MSDFRSRVNQWLRDANAMEKQSETLLSGQVDRIENYPEFRARLESHLAETQSQRQRLETCIERRDASASGLKDLTGKFTAGMQNLSGLFAGDEVVKSV